MNTSASVSVSATSAFASAMPVTQDFSVNSECASNPASQTTASSHVSAHESFIHVCAIVPVQSFEIVPVQSSAIVPVHQSFENVCEIHIDIDRELNQLVDDEIDQIHQQFETFDYLENPEGIQISDLLENYIVCGSDPDRIQEIKDIIITNQDLATDSFHDYLFGDDDDDDDDDDFEEESDDDDLDEIFSESTRQSSSINDIFDEVIIGDDDEVIIDDDDEIITDEDFEEAIRQAQEIDDKRQSFRKQIDDHLKRLDDHIDSLRLSNHSRFRIVRTTRKRFPRNMKFK